MTFSWAALNELALSEYRDIVEGTELIFSPAGSYMLGLK